MQRLISYNHKGLRQWGVLTQDSKSIIPAELLEETYFIPLGETMDEFIETGDEGLLNLAKVLEMNKEDQSIPPVSLSEVEIAVPFYPKRNIFCVGKNYQSHVKEFEKIQMRKIHCILFFLQKQPLLSSVQMKKLIFIEM